MHHNALTHIVMFVAYTGTCNLVSLHDNIAGGGYNRWRQREGAAVPEGADRELLGLHTICLVVLGKMILQYLLFYLAVTEGAGRELLGLYVIYLAVFGEMILQYLLF